MGRETLTVTLIIYISSSRLKTRLSQRRVKVKCIALLNKSTCIHAYNTDMSNTRTHPDAKTRTQKCIHICIHNIGKTRCRLFKARLVYLVNSSVASPTIYSPANLSSAEVSRIPLNSFKFSVVCEGNSRGKPLPKKRSK